jgi:hypothetical protein
MDILSHTSTASGKRSEAVDRGVRAVGFDVSGAKLGDDAASLGAAPTERAFEQNALVVE